jgi:hypothetical protein
VSRFLALPEADQEKAARAYLAAVVEARKDPKAFLQLVGEEETTREPIRVAPHQRVFLDFVRAHPRCVVMMPVGGSKTYLASHLVAWEIGNNPTTRGAVVSATQIQAAKPLRLAQSLIQFNPHYQLVFPDVRPARPWTDTAFQVTRPPGIRDHTMTAFGLEGAILGARLSWILVDDILTHENTRTPDGREKTIDFIENSVLSRLDPVRPDYPMARCILSGTAWHPDDALHKYRERGWPTLRMEAWGKIQVYNVDCQPGCPSPCPLHSNWDSDDLRPAYPGAPPTMCRLTSNKDEDTLWPGRWTREFLVHEQASMLPHAFARSYMLQPSSDDNALCKQEYVLKCLQNGKGMSFVSKWAPASMGPTFTGVDLAIGKGNDGDLTSLVTFAVLPNRRRLILDVESGQWDIEGIVSRVLQKNADYGSTVAVEGNAAQDFVRQIALKVKPDLPIASVITTRQKWNPDYGVPQVFLEMANGVWIWPCDDYMQPNMEIARLAQECTGYVTGEHTGDRLMALTCAREVARRFGHGAGADLGLDLSAFAQSVMGR